MTVRSDEVEGKLAAALTGAWDAERIAAAAHFCEQRFDSLWRGGHQQRFGEVGSGGTLRRSAPRHANATWTGHTYNHRRRQRGLGRLTPVEFELSFTAQPTDAPATTAARPVATAVN